MNIVTALDAEQAKHRGLFDLIKNKTHWKGAIDAFIPSIMFHEFDRAARYFHSRGLRSYEIEGNLVRVKSAGYLS